MDTTKMLVPEWVAQRARLTPDRLAVLYGARRKTYAELDIDVRSLAAALVSRGVHSEDRVAMLMGNGYPSALVIHALVRIGAILVPLNARLTRADQLWQILNSRATFLLHDKGFASNGVELGELVPSLTVVEIPEEVEAMAGTLAPLTTGETSNPRRIDLSAIQSIIYTSGTTGFPKGAQITLGNLWWSAVGSALNLGNHVDDRWLVCLPVFHIGGMSILFRSAIYGVTAVIHGSFDAAAVNRAIDDDEVTIVSVVSTMLQRMLDSRGSRPYPPTLRCVLLGGGPATGALLARCVERGIPVVQTYGLTEAASQVATLSPEDSRRKLGSAGKPLFPTDLQIQSADGPAGPGEIGEILVSGPTVTPGYVDNPGATSAAIRDGWLHTGDLGYFDDEGFLYVVDRRDDLVVTGGENVYPAEVEAVVRQHPDVVDGVIVGLLDERWGQRVALAVQVRADASPSAGDIIAFCRTRLAGYKVPTRVRFIDELPRNATGKILRRVLRDNWPDGSENQ